MQRYSNFSSYVLKVLEFDITDLYVSKILLIQVHGLYLKVYKVDILEVNGHSHEWSMHCWSGPPPGRSRGSYHGNQQPVNCPHDVCMCVPQNLYLISNNP